MNTTEQLIAELMHEARTTRRVLERVPEERLTWTPHPKSLTLGQLALHVALIPGAIAELASELEREVPNVPRPQPNTRAEILSAHDRSVATAAAKLAAWTAADLKAEWRMTHGGRTLFAVPRSGLIRTVMLNHWYHHRGQLAVYLRLLDVPVPAIYGESADEKPFAASA